MKKSIIAIDGPSGVGKSTLSRQLAEKLGYLNLDTGAMYRVVALAASRQGISAAEPAALATLCREIAIRLEGRDGGERVLLDGEDVTEAIRTSEVTRLTPLFAARPEVRRAMVALQRELGREGGVVLEGRDIGTAVFPEADIKFFLRAAAAERGRRRYLEMEQKGLAADLDQTIADVEARDVADSTRTDSPLIQAEDAIVIDTTELSIEEVLERMLDHIEEVLNLAD